MKSNKKRILFVLAILTMAILLSFVFVACDKAGTDKTGTDIAADYKVTIHPNNGQGDIVWDITKEIPTITKDGFHIAGYFLDAQLTISTTLESLKATGITKNIDVYVKWEEDVCEHVEVTDAAVAPTCTEKGRTEGKHCSKCGKILQAQTEIPALGHDLEHHDGQPATCTEKGWKEYDTCKREGCDYSTYEEIPALGHKGGTATCTEQATCSVCGEKYGNTLGHNYGTLIPQTNATCSATGIRSHYKCSSCNKLFADDEHKTEITESDLIISIDENAHDFGKWTRNDGTETHTRVCSFNNEHTETENCHGGTATCTEQAVCEKCNAKYGELAKHDYKDGVCTVCGAERANEELKYSLNSDGTAYTVTGIGTCTDTEIIIPSEYNAKPVTSIGYNAFSGCTGLTSITIPDSVTSIGGGAFRNCTGLTSIIVVEGNSKYHSAGNCIIETATNTLILGCKTSVIPTDGSVTSIGEDAFFGCSGLTNITIPDSVTSIGNSAFEGCTGLTSVTIGNSVTSIGRSAFSDCTSLTSISIPNSVMSIDEGALRGCSSLETITIPFVGARPITTDNYNDGYKQVFGWIFGYEKTESGKIVNGAVPQYVSSNVASTNIYWYYIPTSLKTVVLGNTIQTIPFFGFFNCNWLTSITIPDSVTSIGGSAFSFCTGLTTVNWNATECTGAGLYSNPIFQGCSNLATVNIGDNVKFIPSYAFRNCTGLTSITIPDSVTSIGESAFSGCTELTSIIVVKGNSKYHSAGNCLIETATKTLILGCKTSDIPTDGSVTSIGKDAFYFCSGLTSITIPDSVTSIGGSAFSFCTGLTNVTIPNSVTSIGWGAFKGCSGLTSVTIGNGVTSIGPSTFYNCTGLTSVIIGNGVTSIGDFAFQGCSGLTSITIPDSVTSIGQGAFCDCSGLTSVTIGNGVTSIGYSAFSGCTGLTSITFNGTMEQWNAVSKGTNWKNNVPSTCIVHCTDDDISI